jgi:hypothetical protein
MSAPNQFFGITPRCINQIGSPGLKPVTDEQIFMTSSYVACFICHLSRRVHVQRIFYDSFYAAMGTKFSHPRRTEQKDGPLTNLHRVFKSVLQVLLLTHIQTSKIFIFVILNAMCSFSKASIKKTSSKYFLS